MRLIHKAPRTGVLVAAIASCFAANAQANPIGPTVANGQVSILRNANLLQITNSPSSIINWQSFSIGAGEITRFMQQSSASAVLNRVTTQNPSSILGSLQSNGRVFLLNPSGIVFGPGSQLNVGGLVASSLNLSDADFLGGRFNFTQAPGAGAIVNRGTINTAQGGSVYLVGPAVTNSGIITSPKGEVVLAAGNSVQLVDPGTPNLRVEITAPDNQATNLGQIVADSGRVGIYAGLIDHSGTIRADSVDVTAEGHIILKATKSVTLEAGSVLSATGSNGANGGFIETSGKSVTIEPGAVVTAAAPAGRPGTWLIDPVDITITHAGGSTLGTGSSQTYAPNAGASISDGTINATLDGGTDVIIQTSGGAGGNGDITINGTAAGGAAAVLNSSGGARTLSLVADRNIVMNSGASIAGSGSNPLSVTFNSNAGGASSGNIQMQSGASITTFGGNVVMGGGVDPLVGYTLGSGATQASASGIYIAGNINAGAGNVTMHGRGAAGNILADGVALVGGTLFSNGQVTIGGVAQAWHADFGCTPLCDFVAGVHFMNAGTRLSTATGTVNVTGSNSVARTRTQGVTVDAATVETAGTGTLTLNGTSTPYPDTNWGVGIIGGTVRSTAAGGGRLTLIGSASPADGGVVLLGGNVTSAGGEILIKVSDASAFGAVSSSIVNAGAGTLTLSLAGGTASDNNLSITAGALRLLGSGSYSLGGSNNNVGTLASDVAGTVSYNNMGGLTLGSIASFDGAALSTTTGVLTNGAVGITAGGALHNSGTSIIASGNTLSITGTSLTNDAGGAIRGLGTLNLNGVTGNTLANNGSIAPGISTSTGTLAVTGNVSVGSSGSLDVRLGGAAAGQFDQLAVTGTASLGGALTATIPAASGYTPNGESFPVLTYGSSTGSFAMLNVPTNFQGTYNALDFTLTHTPVAGEFWTNASALHDSLWTNPGNWSLSRVPTGTDAVTLNLGTANTVHVGSGTNSAGTLTSIASNSLLIDGGSLTVLDTANLAGPVTVAGTGALNLSGTGAAATINSLTISGGALTAGRDLVVSNAFSHTAGALNTTAKLAITQATGDLALTQPLNAATLQISVQAGSLTVGAALNTAGTGDTTLTTSSAGTNSIVLNAAVGNSTGNTTLASAGSISGSGVVSGNQVTLSGATGVGVSGTNRVNVSAATLTATGGPGVFGGSPSTSNVYLSSAGPVELVGYSNTSTSGGDYDLTSAGTITVSSVVNSGTSSGVGNTFLTTTGANTNNIVVQANGRVGNWSTPSHSGVKQTVLRSVGSITGSGTVAGDNVVLDAAMGVGVSASNRLLVQPDVTLVASAGVAGSNSPTTSGVFLSSWPATLGPGNGSRSGGVYDLSASSITVANAVNSAGTGDTTLTTSSASTNSIVLNAAVGNSTGNTTLASAGSISGPGVVSGNQVTLSGATGVGVSTTSRVNTNAQTLTANSSTSGGVFVNQVNAVTLGTGNGAAGASSYNLTSGGAISVAGAVNATGTGDTSLQTTGATANGIVLDAQVGNITGNTYLASAGDITGSGLVSGNSAFLEANGGIGNKLPVNTSTTGLLSLTAKGVESAGNISVVEANALNTSRVSLSTDASAQTVSLSAPSIAMGGSIGNATDDLALIATTGDIVGSAGRLFFFGTPIPTATANNLTLDAAGGIKQGPPLISFPGFVPQTATTGTLSLTTHGVGSAGNISLVETNALDTSRVSLSTDASAQTVTLSALAIALGGSIGNTTDDLVLKSTTGNITGGTGTVTANNLTLDGSGGIGIGIAVNTNAVGTFNLTTHGKDTAGNISVVETNALNTGRVSLSTDASAQTVSLSAPSIAMGGSIGNATDDLALIATTGDIVGRAGLMISGVPMATAHNLTLDATGGIKQAPPLLSFPGFVPLTATTGTLSLTTHGVGSPGNISLVETNALNTNRVSLSTDASAQTVSLSAPSIAVGGSIGNTTDDLVLKSTTGNITGGTGTVTANNLTLDAAGAIQTGFTPIISPGLPAFFVSRPVSTATTGTLSLTTHGADSAGNINVIEANTLYTGRVLLSTDATAQTVSLSAPSIAVNGNIGNTTDDLALRATTGNIIGGTGTLTANNLTLDAADAIPTGFIPIISSGLPAFFISRPVNTATTGTLSLATHGADSAGNINVIEANTLYTGRVLVSTDVTAQTVSLSAPSIAVNGNIGNATDDLLLRATTGNIIGGTGTMTANNLTLDAAGAIQAGFTPIILPGLPAFLISRPVSTATTGTLSLTTHGVGSAGNISLVETNALNTSRVGLTTDASAQTVSLIAPSIAVGGSIGNTTDDLVLKSATGNITGGAGTVTANNLTLDGSGGIGIDTAVNTNTVGTLSLTTHGNDTAGNINVVEANALDTGRVLLSTDATAQTVSLSAPSIVLGGDLGNDVDALALTSLTGAIVGGGGVARGNSVALDAAQGIYMGPAIGGIQGKLPYTYTAGVDLRLTSHGTNAAGNIVVEDKSGNIATKNAVTTTDPTPHTIELRAGNFLLNGDIGRPGDTVTLVATRGVIDGNGGLVAGELVQLLARGPGSEISAVVSANYLDLSATADLREVIDFVPGANGNVLVAASRSAPGNIHIINHRPIYTSRLTVATENQLRQFVDLVAPSITIDRDLSLREGNTLSLYSAGDIAGPGTLSANNIFLWAGGGIGIGAPIKLNVHDAMILAPAINGINPATNTYAWLSKGASHVATAGVGAAGNINIGYVNPLISDSLTVSTHASAQTVTLGAPSITLTGNPGNGVDDWVFSGPVVTAGGTPSGKGQLINRSGSDLILAPAAAMSISSPIVNDGTLNLSGNFDVTSSFTNSGTINVNAGTLTLDVDAKNAGMLNIGGGSTFQFGKGSLSNTAAGTISGSGTVNTGGTTLINNGMIAPGGTGGVASLSVIGDLSFGTTGSLVLERASATSYDQLAVSGKTTLAGRLGLTNLTPSLIYNGSTYTLMTYGSRSGTFTTLSLPTSYSATYLADRMNIAPPNLLQLINVGVQSAASQPAASTAAIVQLISAPGSSASASGATSGSSASTAAAVDSPAQPGCSAKARKFTC